MHFLAVFFGMTFKVVDGLSLGQTLSDVLLCSSGKKPARPA